MKKKYQVFAIKVVMIVLGLFIISAVVLTYEEALKIRDEYEEVCYEKGDFITDIRYEISDESSTDEAVKSAYKALENADVPEDDIGFYSELKDKKGTTVAHSKKYMGTIYGDVKKKDKCNEEAKKICEKVYNDFINGDRLDDQTSEGIFTTYVAGTGYITEKAVMPYVYVFHPVAIAMSELSGLYMILSAVTIIMVIIICIMVKKMYMQQSEFEKRTRKMTRGVAHELKTPLAITKSYVENWQYIDEEDRDDYCRNMVDEIDHMNMLVNDLLELSRMESGVKELQKEEVDVLGLTNTIYAHMKGMIEERNLEMNIVTDGAQKEYLVNADLEMMRVVITNFVSNAVKYADKKITVHLAGVGKKIAFQIENDGAGIQKEDIDRVWDTFYKTDDARTNRIGSSGLGLAITKNILLLHGAKYGCTSDKGKTTFWFELKKMEE